MNPQTNACPTRETADRLGECATEARCGHIHDSAPTIRVTVEVAAHHSFSEALYALKAGHRISRKGWNAGGMWAAAQYPDKNSKMSRPYMYLKTADNELVPWVPSVSDIFAGDWAVLPIQPI